MEAPTFGDIVQVICKYPKMYLMHGTFGEVLAFLEGYGKGAGLDEAAGSFFNPFHKWLCNRGWKDTKNFWRSFRDSYGDEQTAITEFARLWAEYEAEMKSHFELDPPRVRG